MFEAGVRVVSLEPNTIATFLKTFAQSASSPKGKAKPRSWSTISAPDFDRVRELTARSDYRPRTLMLEWLEPAFAPGIGFPNKLRLPAAKQGFAELVGPVQLPRGRIRAYAPK